MRQSLKAATPASLALIHYTTPWWVGCVAWGGTEVGLRINMSKFQETIPWWILRMGNSASIGGVLPGGRNMMWRCQCYRSPEQFEFEAGKNEMSLNDRRSRSLEEAE